MDILENLFIQDFKKRIQNELNKTNINSITHFAIIESDLIKQRAEISFFYFNKEMAEAVKPDVDLQTLFDDYHKNYSNDFIND